MRVRYQGGYLRCVSRKSGPACWEFLWRENAPDGKRVRRTAGVILANQQPNAEMLGEKADWSRQWCESATGVPAIQTGATRRTS